METSSAIATGAGGNQAALAIISTSSGMTRGKMIEFQIEQENQIVQLKAKIDGLQDELAALASEKNEYQGQSFSKDTLLENAAANLSIMESDVKTLRDAIVSKNTEIGRYIEVRKSLEATIKSNSETAEKREEDFRSRQIDLKSLKDSLSKAEQLYDNELFRSEKLEKDHDAQINKINRIQQACDAQKLTIQKTASQNHEYKFTLDSRSNELAILKETHKQNLKEYSTLTKRFAQLEGTLSTVETDRDTYRVF